MFGDLCKRPLNPLMKNFWFITIIIPVSSNWTSPIATWLPSNHSVSGNPNIICPIEKYIRITRNITDAISLRSSCGVS